MSDGMNDERSLFIQTNMQTRSFSIRDATADDITAVAGIYGKSVLTGVASYEIDPPDAAEMAGRYASIVAGAYPYLVAETGGRIAGYAYASAFRTRPAYRYTVEDSIYVDPDFQGQGVGRALLSQLIGECTSRGYRQMLAVIGGAHPASIALHQALGFEMAGQIRASGLKFGRWLDTAIMQLPLGDGDASLPQ